jgi:hypothetical protein
MAMAGPRPAGAVARGDGPIGTPHLKIAFLVRHTAHIKWRNPHTVDFSYVVLRRGHHVVYRGDAQATADHHLTGGARYRYRLTAYAADGARGGTARFAVMG